MAKAQDKKMEESGDVKSSNKHSSEEVAGGRPTKCAVPPSKSSLSTKAADAEPAKAPISGAKPPMKAARAAKANGKQKARVKKAAAQIKFA